MRIWIDLSNSPHGPLFHPIVRRLGALGHEVCLTAREHAQTAALARERWPEIEILGGPSPAGSWAKARAIAERCRQLRRWAADQRPDVALSHNSYAQITAARSLALPIVTSMDYEHQPANHLAFRLADIVLVPAIFPALALRRCGARPRKVRFYDGLKEQIYLGDFEPDAEAVASAGARPRNSGAKLVVSRTPPTGALYHQHRHASYIELLRTINDRSDVDCVILPRSAYEREELAVALPGALLPAGAVDARSLMYFADLVIGAGGTMTREAALLGVPTFSVFAGRPAATDEWLERHGRLARLSSVDQLLEIGTAPQVNGRLEDLRTAGAKITERFVQALVQAVDRPHGQAGARASARV